MSIPSHMLRFANLIVRRSTRALGIGSHAVTALGWAKYAEEHGTSATIDLMTFENTYRQDSDSDPWQTFFVQPSGMSPLEAMKSLHKVVNAGPPDFPDPSGIGYYDDTFISKWRSVAERYLILSPKFHLLRRIDSGFECRAGKTLGVLLRGTDYTTMRPKNHPIQPKIDTVIEDAKKACAENGFENVFLVTEDTQVIDEFDRGFKTNLIVSDQRRCSYDNKSFLCDNKTVHHNIDMAIDYVSALKNLSTCEGILSGRSSGAMIALLMSKGFSFQRFYNLGAYQ